MKTLRLIKLILDRLLLVVSLTLLAVMIVIIIYQVFSRQILNSTPSWSEELSRILFVWVSFLGIAYGFKEKLHIALGLIVNMMPKKVQDIFDYFAKGLVIFLGVIMIYYGWNFTTLMANNVMPGTGLPSSMLYVVMPISGFYVTLYGTALLFKKGMHQEFDDANEE
ncbi:TRAP transporter small permease [Oceanobacillus polygoni]|uniref:TRAP-type C4-dicarboxylate transport system permease small subunit n=1 Tax=Oceanobacillus polygoni TaxID=1235259 RepID=A0A9X1CJJ1_9BACI|nr:TRAP transporter small permease [Oceanobacillus polygoni]MBP2079063.1 TRAP-type C4-dicarboxylate transport system permease small subunit [Oceanobacillus polygoni]